jgi:uncharacterized damage-inducible protein DinB
MTRDEVTTLLDFHYWARDRMFSALEGVPADLYLRGSGGSFGSIRDTVVHIYSADWVWYSRWTGSSPTSMLDPGQYPDVGSIARAWTTLEGQVRALLASLGEEGMQRPIRFKSLAGSDTSELFWRLVQHVVNHGSYHRGQVTTLLRQAGVAPPKSTDLITFYRERSGQ